MVDILYLRTSILRLVRICMFLSKFHEFHETFHHSEPKMPRWGSDGKRSPPGPAVVSGLFHQNGCECGARSPSSDHSFNSDLCGEGLKTCHEVNLNCDLCFDNTCATFAMCSFLRVLRCLSPPWSSLVQCWNSSYKQLVLRWLCSIWCDFLWDLFQIALNCYVVCICLLLKNSDVALGSMYQDPTHYFFISEAMCCQWSTQRCYEPPQRRNTWCHLWQVIGVSGLQAPKIAIRLSSVSYGFVWMVAAISQARKWTTFLCLVNRTILIFWVSFWEKIQKPFPGVSLHPGLDPPKPSRCRWRRRYRLVPRMREATKWWSLL